LAFLIRTESVEGAQGISAAADRSVVRAAIFALWRSNRAIPVLYRRAVIVRWRFVGITGEGSAMFACLFDRR
jgi:hypothetical protein